MLAGLLIALVAALAGCDSSGSGEEGSPSPFDEAEAAPGMWHFVGVEGAVCRDGSPTGLGVRLQEDPEGLVIYFAGGGVCLGGECSPATSFDSTALRRDRFDGIFDDERADNPLAGYDFAYVPNCTNDLHAGSRPDVPIVVDGEERRQQLVGHRNVERYADLLAPYFSDRLPREAPVVAYGISAGSFGAVFNYATLADAFAGRPVDLISESGPMPANEDVLTPAFQQVWREAWNLRDALPPPSDCPACYGPEGGGLWNLYGYIARAYPDAALGLLSSEEDASVRRFFDAGRSDCTDETPGGCLSADAYRQALYDLRERLPARWATYYTPDAEHVFAVQDATYYDVTVAGTTLTGWIGRVLDGESPRVPDR